MRRRPQRSDSLDSACRGVNAVISTASSTLSRQAGDSIESVDDTGQLHLVEAAKSAGISRFIFVSFRRPAGISFPLADAKEHVEHAITDLNFTTIQASWFMEVWLSPALGFDYLNASARIYGPGTSPVSWARSWTSPKCAFLLCGTGSRAQDYRIWRPRRAEPTRSRCPFRRDWWQAVQAQHIPEEALRAQFEGSNGFDAEELRRPNVSLFIRGCNEHYARSSRSLGSNAALTNSPALFLGRQRPIENFSMSRLGE